MESKGYSENCRSRGNATGDIESDDTPPSHFLIGVADEKVLTSEQWIREVSGRSLFIGDGALAYQKILRDRLGSMACFAPSRANRIRAAAVAQLGLKRLLTRGADPPETLTPKYIRKSDAERKMENKALPSPHH